mmetsp:Transcript_26818/g.38063  ORF Transcript_26818/g.38063 Transcript_26818/m.38063 type:complete len:90 (+) Transcript_26818:2244-2513(+)
MLLQVHHHHYSPLFEPGPYPECHICGGGYDITLSDPVVAIPEQNVSLSCAEFRNSGLYGHIPAELCPWTAVAVESVCGCTRVDEASEGV